MCLYIRERIKNFMELSGTNYLIGGSNICRDIEKALKKYRMTPKEPLNGKVPQFTFSQQSYKIGIALPEETGNKAGTITKLLASETGTKSSFQKFIEFLFSRNFIKVFQ